MKHILSIAATVATIAGALLVTEFTSVSMSNKTMAAASDRGDRVAVTDDECKSATWPNIPKVCLERVAPRGSLGVYTASGAKSG